MRVVHFHFIRVAQYHTLVTACSSSIEFSECFYSSSVQVEAAEDFTILIHNLIRTYIDVWYSRLGKVILRETVNSTR